MHNKIKHASKLLKTRNQNCQDNTKFIKQNHLKNTKTNLNMQNQTEM